MIGDLLAILLLCGGCLLFWQQRRQSELAKLAIHRKCKQLNLQLISTAFYRHSIKDTNKRWHWHTVYHFEFSSLGDDCYQGELVMFGFQPVRFSLPPYRVESME